MNALKEFQKHVGDHVVLCASISCKRVEFNLPEKYSQADYSNFLASLDFLYDDGYGTQELDGIIWYIDGTYSDRREYDGSEWWEHHQCPPIPDTLRANAEETKNV